MTTNDELLCLADTKLVLGNWFAECVMNGRSLPDFAAMLGMCTSSYGQTRAIYQYLAAGNDAYVQLERGRRAREICSMEMLDAPPQNWEDFIVSVWLAEEATWALASAYLDHSERAVGALARRIGEEAYFHFKYAHGWLKVFRDDSASIDRVAASIAFRLPYALDWFGPHDDRDDTGHDDRQSASQLANRFRRSVAAGLDRVGVAADFEGSAPLGDWRAAQRRRSDLPDALFEIIRFKSPNYAH